MRHTTWMGVTETQPGRGKQRFSFIDYLPDRCCLEPGI